MLDISIGLFALAALGGLLLAYRHFTGQSRPWGLSLLHGGLAAAGLVLLGVNVLRLPTPALALWALGLFVVAALGGFLLFAYHLRNQRLPSAVVLIHGGVAVFAFALLLAFRLG